MVRAKFKVESVTQYAESKSIKLLPVTIGSEENKTFYKWTPSGSIELMTVNLKAAEQFEVGKEYYIDFTQAES